MIKAKTYLVSITKNKLFDTINNADIILKTDTGETIKSLKSWEDLATNINLLKIKDTEHGYQETQIIIKIV